MITGEELVRESHEWFGCPDQACGPTAGEKGLVNQQTSTASTLTDAFSKAFGTNSSIMNSVSGVLSPMVNAGLNQEGFSPQMTAAETANIQDQGKANEQFASNQANEKMAQAGQSNPGAVAAVDANAAQAGEQQTAANQNAFNVQNMEQGEKNFFQASTELPAIAGELENDTSAAGGAAEGADAEALKGQEQMQQQQNSWISPVVGAVGGVLAPFTGGASLAVSKGIQTGLNPGSNSGGSSYMPTFAPGLSGGAPAGLDTSLDNSNANFTAGMNLSPSGNEGFSSQLGPDEG